MIFTNLEIGLVIYIYIYIIIIIIIIIYFMKFEDKLVSAVSKITGLKKGASKDVVIIVMFLIIVAFWIKVGLSSTEPNPEIVITNQNEV